MIHAVPVSPVASSNNVEGSGTGVAVTDTRNPPSGVPAKESKKVEEDRWLPPPDPVISDPATVYRPSESSAVFSCDWFNTIKTGGSCKGVRSALKLIPSEEVIEASALTLALLVPNAVMPPLRLPLKETVHPSAAPDSKNRRENVRPVPPLPPECPAHHFDFATAMSAVVSRICPSCVAEAPKARGSDPQMGLKGIVEGIQLDSKVTFHGSVQVNDGTACTLGDNPRTIRRINATSENLRKIYLLTNEAS
jgi:hypothetical protein